MEKVEIDVNALAELARIQLTDQEKELFGSQIPNILDYVERLSEVNTERVEETAQVTGLMDVLREDTPREMSEQELVVNREQLLAAAPQVEDNYLKVPAIFAEADNE